MTDDNRLHVLPSRGEQQKVTDTLQQAIAANFDEVVLLGFKDGKTFLMHSKIANDILVMGALEDMKMRMRFK